ncbi:MAG TPA: ABC transporter permease [Puia sp.]|uniref:ABC transporter permease n=1 Tax=Puia sp. TaxID=2045100 RepID=UPI002B5AEE0E|nr:ABC transporter permease [Puia sp.]HVU98364.1 ABC transporter permease [Puia sp.]
MLKNFFTVAWRNLYRGKGFSFINISGLAVGMASALLILLWVQNELSYDGFYHHSDRLYQVWRNGKDNTGISSQNITPQIVGPTMKKDYPEVERASRVFWDETLLLSRGEKKISIIGTMADPDFLEMFDFPLLQGDRATALSSPTGMVITQKTAKAFFGNEDPMGKTIRIDNKYDYAVSAVLKDLPNNTQFDFQFILPWDYVRMTGQSDSLWDKNSTHNYVLLKPHTDLAAFNAKTRDIYRQHAHLPFFAESFLYPVNRLRLYSDFENGKPAGGRIERVRIFIVIAVFILLIACINFMNMSTARSEKRAKEVGIRKVSGALRGSLISQFLGESVLLAALAGAIALALVEVSLPFFNGLTGKVLAIGFGDWYFWLAFAGFIVMTGVLAGSYPALFLSAFRPVAVLKGNFKKSNALMGPRKVLVVLQFSFAIILVICTLVIKKQVNYARDREVGYDRRNMIWCFLSGDINKNYDAIKYELLSQGIATAITKSSAPLTQSWSTGAAEWPGKDPNDRTDFNFFLCDGNIVQTAGLQLVAGRDIDPKHYPTDSNAVLLNETAVKVMRLATPIGTVVDKGAWGTDWHVVGVVKDFIIESPFDKVKPMMIKGPKANWFNLMHIKLNPAHSTAQDLAGVEQVLKQYNPLYPFEYHFIDQQYAQKFEDEQASGKLTAVFAGLTIFISCLGLFGLAAYMAENRRKEIGVRKVLGASVGSIAGLLSGDFVKLVLIAMVVASPVAWWVMSRWLAGYPYHIGLSIWVFVAAGFGAVGIALATVSFQAIRAAMSNPVKSLRSE